MMQWNISYQRQIAVTGWCNANYLGNAGRDIWGSTDVNYAMPIAGATTSNTNQRRLTYLTNPTLGQYYGEIQQTDPGGNSEYHALFVSAQHQFARHYTARTNYTWSHCVSSWDFAGELAGTIYQNPLNRAEGERGNCGYDHRQVFVATLVAVSPGVGSPFLQRLTREWQISPIISFNTGNPIQITDGGKDISLSGQDQDRPEVILPGAVHTVTQGGIAPMWFNPDAFVCAGNTALSPSCSTSTGLFGNLGRNSVYGPGQIQWDMAVSRRFSLNERFKFEYRSDFFNILNHANWNNPTSTITSSTFGLVTAFGSPRIIQMAMKLFF